MEPLTIKITTLTPLWTGGVEMTTDRLHETGIIGSLRWWYEVIVRGLGGKACDPTADGCKFNNEGYEKAKREGKGEQEALSAAGLCDVCQVFGATGWSRCFRWRAEGGQLANGSMHAYFRNPRSGWYYNPGLIATKEQPIKAHLVTLRGDPNALENVVLVALRLAERWGGLGAKTQHGYGVVKVVARRGDQEVIPDSSSLADAEPRPIALPDLTCFFFTKFRLKTDAPADWWMQRGANGRFFLGVDDVSEVQKWAGITGAVPISPAVKNQLRFGQIITVRGRSISVSVVPVVAADASRRTEKYIFGITEDPLRSAKIHISAAYRYDGRWEFRVWGWIPQEVPHERWAPSGFDRNRFLTQLHSIITDPNFWQAVFGANIVDLSPGQPPAWDWREFNAPTRDTVGHFTSPHDFLNNLL